MSKMSRIETLDCTLAKCILRSDPMFKREKEVLIFIFVLHLTFIFFSPFFSRIVMRWKSIYVTSLPWSCARNLDFLPAAIDDRPGATSSRPPSPRPSTTSSPSKTRFTSNAKCLIRWLFNNNKKILIGFISYISLLATK